jgi:hypothetical protein
MKKSPSKQTRKPPMGVAELENKIKTEQASSLNVQASSPAKEVKIDTEMAKKPQFADPSKYRVNFHNNKEDSDEEPQKEKWNTLEHHGV